MFLPVLKRKLDSSRLLRRSNLRCAYRLGHAIEDCDALPGASSRKRLFGCTDTTVDILPVVHHPDVARWVDAEIGLHLQIADSSEKTIAVPDWPRNSGVDWAADGKSLWVGATSNVSGFGRVESWALLKVDLDGTITTLVENGDVHFWAAVPSPDGHRLALNGAKADISNVWLLENF